MSNLNTPDFDILKSFAYTGIKETVYSFDHPEVQLWTSHFEERACKRNIYERFFNSHPQPSRVQAIVVGTQWHRFSDFMPWFLCQAAAMVPTNELRHYVIQTAFEELGMRDANEIHPDLFLKTAMSVGLTLEDQRRLAKAEEVTEAITFLKNQLLSMKNFAEMLGIMLGLEIPARENIETIFSSLAFTARNEKFLTTSKFFVLHRQIEIEHVRMNVANFLRFCPDESSRKIFVEGFNKGLDFWELFWAAVSTLIINEKLRNV